MGAMGSQDCGQPCNSHVLDGDRDGGDRQCPQTDHEGGASDRTSARHRKRRAGKAWTEETSRSRQLSQGQHLPTRLRLTWLIS